MSSIDESRIQPLCERLAVETEGIRIIFVELSVLEREIVARKQYLARNPQNSVVRAEYRKLQSRYSAVNTRYRACVTRAEGLQKRIDLFTYLFL